MDGLLTLKEYVSHPHRRPKLAAWRAKCEKQMDLRLHSWPSTRSRNQLAASNKALPSQIDQDPFAYFLSPSAESDQAVPPTKPHPELHAYTSSLDTITSSPASSSPSPPSHFLPHHSPTSSPETKIRRQQQRERRSQEIQPALSPEIIEIKPKIPIIVITPPDSPSTHQGGSSSSPLPEPFAMHSPLLRGRPQPRLGSQRRSRRTPPRSWRPRHITLPAILEEGDKENDARETPAIGLGIA